MSIEVGKGVIYHWFDAREDQLEDIESWTDAARKIREVTDDVYRLAVAFSPVGRARFDQSQKIKTSHYKAGTSFAGRFRYRQVVGNRAPHALYVHEGTIGATGKRIHNQGRWLGPVFSDGGPGGVTLAGPWWPRRSTVRSTRTGSARWRAFHGYVYFDYYTFKGQTANGWLARAGGAAYGMPGNH